ncbi:MAG TPA: DUF397 domain-containing protein [Streptosporangiaceae bacterium]|nr:DUF397 domain-containing protein [Streptosporangiaceae bacterium]
MHTPIQPATGATAETLDGAVWHKSSYSGTQGNCVEVARNLPGMVAVRDSKHPSGPALITSPDEWRTFLAGVRRGQFEP